MALGTRPEASGEKCPVSQEVSDCQEVIGKARGPHHPRRLWASGSPCATPALGCCFHRGVQSSGVYSTTRELRDILGEMPHLSEPQFPQL